LLACNLMILVVLDSTSREFEVVSFVGVHENESTLVLIAMTWAALRSL
jgi:hypothetical protein